MLGASARYVVDRRAEGCLRGVSGGAAGAVDPSASCFAEAPVGEAVQPLPQDRSLPSDVPREAVVRLGIWVRVRAGACSTFAGRRGLVCSLDRDKRAAMVLLVGERKPLSFGVRELELATRQP